MTTYIRKNKLINCKYSISRLECREYLPNCYLIQVSYSISSILLRVPAFKRAITHQNPSSISEVSTEGLLLGSLAVVHSPLQESSANKKKAAEHTKQRGRQQIVWKRPINNTRRILRVEIMKNCEQSSKFHWNQEILCTLSTGDV